jgi:hypothetical protein
LRGGLGRSGYHLGTSQLPSLFALNSRSNCKITDLRVRGKGDCGFSGFYNINSRYNLNTETICFIETLTTTYQTVWHNKEIHNLNFLLPCKSQEDKALRCQVYIQLHGWCKMCTSIWVESNYKIYVYSRDPFLLIQYPRITASPRPQKMEN